MKMSRSRISFPFLVILFIITHHPLVSSDDIPFKKGVIIKKVTCTHRSGQSYALYLPSFYSSEKKWPIVFAFEPGARGTIPLQLYKNAAETYGYIVVCSNNSHNGPGRLIIEAMKSVWRDTQLQFSIDKQRIFATGFSGGARISSFFAEIINNPVCGIIACGAGLSPHITHEQIKSSLYYGIYGIGDFNYQEMKKLDQELDERGITNRFVVFNGYHQWPSEDLCYQAIEWMEIQLIKKGINKKDDRLIEKVFQNEIERALEWEKAGNIPFAIAAYRSVIEVFAQWHVVTDSKKKLAQLIKSKDYKNFLKEEDKRYQKEQAQIKKFIGIFAYIKKRNPGLSQLDNILSGLEIRKLQKQSKKKVKIYKHGLYRRLLEILAYKASKEASSYITQQDYIKSIIFNEIATNAGKDSLIYGYYLYNLACSYSLNLNKKKALRNLQYAVNNGFAYLSYIENDKNLEFIKNDPKYKKIIKFLR